ncbi:TAXI family TRAP transporter solute-binding subunit, partial [Glaciimonas sp. GG7]
MAIQDIVLKPQQSAQHIKAKFVAISWRDLAISFGPIVLLAGVAVWLAIWLINPAPPKTITIATGPEHSNFWNVAEKYQKILARNGVKLIIVRSEGSLDNLKKLNDPTSGVDLGFVQGGVASGLSADLSSDHLMSLGSIAYVPVSVFYRSKKILDRLSELRGKRVAIGPQGSGSRVLALTLLKANGIEPGGKTELLDLGGDEAASALTDGKIDAAFLMGDSAAPPTMGKLLRAPGIRLLDFAQASGYARRFSYLNELKIPKGVFDFGRNIPDHDIRLIAPTAELIAIDSCSMNRALREAITDC